MPLNACAAYATYPSSVPLDHVMHALNAGGVAKESICMMLSPTHPIATTVREANVKPFERAANASTAGLIGWLSQFGAVMIPTFGFFIHSRAFLRALLLDSDSSGNGRWEALVRLGFSKGDAERFESQVRRVGALLYVSCPEASKTQWALDTLRSAGAEQAGMLDTQAKPTELAGVLESRTACTQIAASA